MHRRILLSLLVSGLVLSACQTLPVNQQPPVTQIQSQSKPVLGSALLKRTLQLGILDGKVVPLAAAVAPSQGSFAIKQVVATPISARADIAIGRPGMSAMYYYGGGEFNQYMIQYAEESIHKGPKGKSLLEVYNQDVKALLGEWDADARLVESRANLNGSDEEWIYLPGKDNEPLKLKPLYVFRFSSTPKKETLNVYVLDDEIRVHRMVWGEPSIDISKVKIDSDEAVEIARKAFADKSKKPGYPVYPEVQEPNMEIIYDVPSELKWNLQLNQQDGKQIRYFLNFSFERKVEGQEPGRPVPMPMPLAEDANQNNAPKPAVAPSYYVQSFYGSIEIDAVSGQIKNMNRPVYWRPYPAPMPVEPNNGDGSTSGGSAGAAGGETPPAAKAQ